MCYGKLVALEGNQTRVKPVFSLVSFSFWHLLWNRASDRPMQREDENRTSNDNYKQASIEKRMREDMRLTIPF
jgi:uncharacterized membrane protein